MFGTQFGKTEWIEFGQEVIIVATVARFTDADFEGNDLLGFVIGLDNISSVSDTVFGKSDIEGIRDTECLLVAYKRSWLLVWVRGKQVKPLKVKRKRRKPWEWRGGDGLIWQ